MTLRPLRRPYAKPRAGATWPACGAADGRPDEGLVVVDPWGSVRFGTLLLPNHRAVRRLLRGAAAGEGSIWVGARSAAVQAAAGVVAQARHDALKASAPMTQGYVACDEPTRALEPAMPARSRGDSRAAARGRDETPAPFWQGGPSWMEACERAQLVSRLRLQGVGVHGGWLIRVRPTARGEEASESLDRGYAWDAVAHRRSLAETERFCRSLFDPPPLSLNAAWLPKHVAAWITRFEEPELQPLVTDAVAFILQATATPTAYVLAP